MSVERERKDERIYLGLCRVCYVAIFLFFPSVIIVVVFVYIVCPSCFVMLCYLTALNALDLFEWPLIRSRTICSLCDDAAVAFHFGNFTSLTIYTIHSLHKNLLKIYKGMLVCERVWAVSAHHSELNHLFPTDFVIIQTQSKSATAKWTEWDRGRSTQNLFHISDSSSN